jgi:hypothetical protein
MDTPIAMRIRTGLGLAGACAALGLAGCGSAGSDAASRPTPPTPIVVSALVGPAGVTVSPQRFGAGPILLTVSNQGRRPVALTLARRGRGGALARTAPINPQGVTQLKVDIGRGTYALTATAAGRRTDAQRTRAAQAPTITLRVGRERAGGGDQVLQP